MNTDIEKLLADLKSSKLRSADDALGFEHVTVLVNDLRAALNLAYKAGKRDKG